MRLLTFAASLVSVIICSSVLGSSAFAQYVHHNYCLRREGRVECAYDTIAQCNQAKQGDKGACIPNSAPINH
jgi:hypothetical protein